ncbi:unnamed protein product [Paramecium sonneborni]|nr:unnamed protein product [Paramecium sonneborni]
MLQLNELIDEHSILLETYLQKQRIHIDKQKLPIICQEQQNSDSQWKQKWEQENRLNHQRNQKINELKKKLEGLEEQCVQTESFQITLELDSWRNKYQNLTKIHNETAEKLKVLEIELEQLKQSQPVEDSDQSKRTSVISTRRRQTKQIEL